MLPDFRGLDRFETEEARYSEIRKRFLESAASLIFDYNLEFHQFCEPRIMQIVSLELYLFCEAWPDESVDRHPEQLSRETWYIVPGVNIARIDITAGSRCEDIYAGLLIREIEGQKGPMLSLRNMIRGKSDDNSWKWSLNEMDLVDQINGRNVFKSGPLRLRQVRRTAGDIGGLRQIWLGPRVGLKPGPYAATALRASKVFRNGMERFDI